MCPSLNIVIEFFGFVIVAVEQFVVVGWFLRWKRVYGESCWGKFSLRLSTSCATACNKVGVVARNQ